MPVQNSSLYYTKDGMHDSHDDDDEPYKMLSLSIDMSALVYGVILSILVGFTSSAALLIYSETGLKQKEGALIPLLWQYATGALIILGLMLVQYCSHQLEGVHLGMEFTDAILVTIHVTSLVGSNSLMITSVYYCDAFVSGLGRNTVLAFMAISSWTVLRNIVPSHGNVLEVIGAILILTASIISVVFKAMRRKKAKLQE